MKTFIILLVLFAGLSPALAQTKNNTPQTPKRNGPTYVKAPKDSVPPVHNLQVIARSYGDSVVLRWAPGLATLWYFANTSGYVVTRYEVDQKKIDLSTKKVLQATPIKPWSLEEWKRRAQRSDTLAAAAAQLLYSKSKAEEIKKKKNTGTSLNESLNRKYELENEHSMALFLADQSAFIATGLGLRFTDKDFSKGKRYVYTVHALTTPTLIKSDTGGVMINTAEAFSTPEMPHIAVEARDRVVKFSWSRLMGSAYFTGYYYERSEDGGNTFKRLNKKPYTQLTKENEVTQASLITLTDSLPQNYKLYQYRIVGITPFGDAGKFSPNLRVMGRDKRPPQAPEQIAATHKNGKQVLITWKKRIKEPDFAGYLVGRSTAATGPFIPLFTKPLPTQTLQFTDTTADVYGMNYYVVSAIDTAGNAGVSIPAYVIMKDSIPPAKPLGLVGKIDTTGLVHLHWKPGKERDLMGYLVYAANDLSHTFTVVSKDFVADTTFTDSVTLRTLTKKIFYKVVAFDKNRNPSLYSNPLALKRPDKVAPVSPVFTSFNVSDTSVVLLWAASSSTDVLTQELYHREKGKEWVLLAKLDAKASSYVDRKVKKQSWYEYTLQAVDDAGLRSERSFPLNVRVYDTGKRPDVQGLTATKSKDGKSAVVSWKYAEKGNYHFILFRSVNGKDKMTYKNLPGSNRTFTDPGLKGGSYEYFVKAVYPDGGESFLSKAVKVVISE